MLSKLAVFIKSLAYEGDNPIKDPLSIELATAVLLCEVMRADGTLEEDEQKKLRNIMQAQFTLSNDEVTEILDTAESLSENATDFYQFTSVLNQHYSLEQRKKIVTLLWQVAYADGELASIEQHIIRRIADLLHLNHAEYIQVKIEATPSQ